MKHPAMIAVSFLLYAAAFPKWDFWWLSFIALMPFFAVLDKARPAVRQGACGMFWGAGTALCMGHWVFSTLVHHYEVPFFRAIVFFVVCLVLPLAVLGGIFALVYRFLREDRFYFYALVAPSLWVLMEYAKEALPFLLPWGGLDIALTPFSAFAQAADCIGAYGLIFVAVMVNALGILAIRRIWRRPSDRKDYRRHWQGYLPLMCCVLLITMPSLYGMYRIRAIEIWISRNLAEGHGVAATLVQGNFSTRERWSGMGFHHRIITHLKMSGASGKGHRVLVWPENTLNSASEVNDDLFSEFMRAIGRDALLIAGGLFTDPATSDVFNCIYFISGTGRLSRYDKHYLLPYAETSPLVDLLDAYYSAPSEFAKGRTPAAVQLPEGTAGASVCMEVLYPDHVRRSVKNGATYLVNVSNDSWFGDSAMPHIHLAAARLRAIENRRYLLRASNSGISAVISPTGRIMAQTRLFQRERIDGEFIPKTDLSGYTRCGDMALYGAVLVLMGALLQLVFFKA